MTWTLAIDTSHVVAVGIARDGEPHTRVVVQDTRAHAEALMPSVLEACGQAGITVRDLDEIVVGMGPGPFTGLRVGVATAWTLAHAAGLVPHGVCSLDVLAVQAGRPEGELLVATDARRKEVYWARYAVGAGSVARLVGPAVDRPADLPQEVRALPTVGRGPVLFPDLFRDGDQAVLDVDAGVLVEVVARRLAAGEAMPVEALYLRRPDALTTAERAAR